jgi:Phage major capsid protein E
MPTTYSTDALVGVVENLKLAQKWMLNRYFPAMSQSETETINFDTIIGKRRVAPFVHSLAPGKVVSSLGREVHTFSPAYIKDKRRINPTEALKRAIGERIGGALTAQERKDAYVAQQLADQMDMIDRRLEIMAVEAIRTGKVTVVGDDYPSVVVDFQRAAALTIAALAGATLWSAGTSKPLKNLNAWAKLVLQTSGAFPIDVIMGLDAWDAFADHADVKAQLNTWNITNATMEMGAQPAEGGILRGRIGNFNIFTYGGWYVDPANDTETEIFPANQVAMVSPLVNGVRAYGSILDGSAGLKALPYYPKTWEEHDPSVEWLMLQSAPLMIPTRPNATALVQVV